MQIERTLSEPKLHAIMYHYVRDLPNTPYPRIKGMLLENFQEQIAWLDSHFEAANLETALEFLNGNYQPSKDLFLLTFDDGLKEHYKDVLPILSKYAIQGLFGAIT